MSARVVPGLPPDRSRLVPTAAGRVYAVDRGPLAAERPPLVLVHGLLVTHHEFRGVVDPLAANRRVIALDLPGCGESDRPLPEDADGYALPWLAARVHEALGALGVDRCDLLAHSLGGAVAVELAATVPALVRRLVLVDAVVFPMELPLPGRMALLPRLGPYLWRQLYRRSELRRHLQRVLSTPELLDERAVDVYWDRLGRDGGREAAYAMLQQLTRLERLRERLAGLATPTLVVWGDRDVLMPVDTGERIAKLVPDAQLRVVEGCGHDVPEERPEELVALVRAFLDEP
jgi:pimeloyl-ACP methyl ester carboxylesterase